MPALARTMRFAARGASLAAAVALTWTPAAAQVTRRSAPLPMVSQPVIQQVPAKDGRTLNAALSRLARDPRDIDALIDAGSAALAMGDVDAATGFFRRADQVSPGNARVKAGLAGTMVRSGDPFGAIPLFEEAERAGALDATFAADRGLAYDLVGDTATAQRYYRQSMARAPSEEVSRRLALSYAIAGDRPSAEATLSPLLATRNLAAWRTRAFALAILGQTEEAVSVANSVLPTELAGGVAPYLRYMPRLTRAQQAAAANLGAFPRASEIGRDDPRVAQFALKSAPSRLAAASADAALTPKGQPLGRDSRRNRRSRNPVAAREAPPEILPTREASTVGSAPLAAAPTPTPTPASAPRPAPAQQVAPAPTPPRALAPYVAAPSPAPARPATVAGPPADVRPGFALRPAAAPSIPSPQPVVQPTATPSPPPPPRSLSDAFAGFGRPSIDVAPAAGAVDLRRIKPARPEPKKPATPPPPSHPSRIWVQVATGRDKAALEFDWRRMARGANEIFAGKQAFISGWGQTNRLLTGPFASEAAATAYIGQLRRADVNDAFVWTSPAGQVVDTLPGTAVPEAAKPARTTSSRSGRAARSRTEAADKAPARSARSSRTRSAAAETEAPRSSKSRKSRASAKEAEKSTTRTRR
jgi:Flp pilus assembly protein TadD